MAAFFIILLTGAIALGAAGHAVAQDRREYDPKIEKWVARKVSAQLGELRGSLAADESVGEATVHDAYAKAREKPKRQSPIFVLPGPAGEPLPPIVMDETARTPRG